MHLESIGLSAASLALVGTTTVVYFSKVAEAKLSKDIAGWVLLFVLGLAMAVASIAFAQHKGVLGAAVLVPAGFAITTSLSLLFFLSQRKTPVGDLKVKVGDTLLPFAALTPEGVAFSSEDLSGRRLLLKFFRGGW
jgi:hypothetical protein